MTGTDHPGTDAAPEAPERQEGGSVITLPRALVTLRGIGRSYPLGGETVHALRDATLSLQHGEQAAVVGPSGSGKSTLLGIVGMLDRATTGEYRFDGEDVTRLAPDQQALVRRRAVGFIFQQFHLLPHLSAEQNVELPLRYQHLDRAERAQRVATALAAVNLWHRRAHRPMQLSGGECQRVAIARALVSRPALLLADEPTGALDSSTGQAVMTLIRALADEQGATLVVITHDRPLAETFPRCIALADGRVVSDQAATRQRHRPCAT
jgi:ABC-type lipoprotein export system ATPase subunit